MSSGDAHMCRNYWVRAQVSRYLPDALGLSTTESYDI